MKLYRSTTADGFVWTGTQADAKEAQGGKDFEQIEVPTDKTGLMEFLNQMEARVGQSGTDIYVMPVAAETTDEPYEETAEDYIPPVRPAIVAPVALDPATCPACLRTNRVAKLAANSSAAISIMADIEDITDLVSIDKIINAAIDRETVMKGGTPPNE